MSDEGYASAEGRRRGGHADGHVARRPRTATAAPARPASSTLIMGVLNVTPDSFSDGGRWQNPDDAVAHAIAMVDAGASIVDVGGESTRPGAVPVPNPEERKRVMPIVRELVARGITVSIDTMHADTALAAVDAGAEIVNDVSGGLADEGMGRVIAETGVHFIAMHWRGGASVEAGYRDVVAEVRSELKSRVAELVVRGVEPSRIVLDPGLGFAKNSEHNWQLLGRLDELASLGHGILIGASRKRFTADLVPEGAPFEERDAPTAVISALAARSGAWAVRVHDVASTRMALDVWQHWQDGAALKEPTA